jgi:hypothetical protein
VIRVEEIWVVVDQHIYIIYMPLRGGHPCGGCVTPDIFLRVSGILS